MFEDGVLLDQPLSLYYREVDATNPDAPTLDEAVTTGSGATFGTVTVDGSGVITGIAVTDGGSGYNPSDPPDVTVTDTAGSPGTGADIEAVVNEFGVITGVTITSGGTGYTAASTTGEVADGEWSTVGHSVAIPDIYGEDGVKVEKPHAVKLFRGARSLAPLDAARTEDGLIIETMLYDNRPEMWALALDQDPTETAATSTTVGVSRIGLSRPRSMRRYELLARGIVDVANGYIGQLYVPEARITSPWTVQSRIKDFTGYTMTFTGFRDLTAASELEELGYYLRQTAPTT